MNGAGAQGVRPEHGGKIVRRYHFHLPGLIYVGITLLLALGAINSQNNLLFAALGLAIGGLLISGIISGAALLGLRVERDPITHAAVGAPLTIGYTITNTNRLFPAYGLNVIELPVQGPRGWERAMPQPRAFVAQVGAKRSARGHAPVLPTSRGRVEFFSVRVWTTFPFGLARKSVTFDLPATAIVRPVELPLRRDVVEELAAPASHGSGAERMPGHGDEFFALREYTPGDSLRRIAWRRSARTGDLVVRQEARPAPLRLWVILWPQLRDGAPAAGPPLERAVALAASVVRTAAAQGLAVGLAAPGVIRPPRTGHRHVDMLVCDLAVADGVGPVEVPAAAMRNGARVVISAGGAPSPAMNASARSLSVDEIDSLVIHEVAASKLSLLESVPSPTSRSASPAGAAP